MKISTLSAIFFFVSILMVSLNAEENQEQSECYKVFDQCMTQCEKLDEGYLQCSEKCDLKYESCSTNKD